MKKPKQQTNYKEDFREAISTVDTEGKRIFLHPTKPKGRYFNARKIVSFVLLALLFGVPFIKIDGQPFFLLDVIDRKFFVLGQLFVPQDFHIFMFGMILLFVFVVLFTVVWGRIWCGWLCPQTIFMEMVYRRIEHWIEGDAPAQRRLNQMPWNAEKIRKKAFKHSLFLLISVLLSNMFLSYFIGVDRLKVLVSKSPLESWDVFIAVMVVAGLIYYIYARFREQVCTTFCPYGRLQGVLLDEKSIAVAYDYIRGEPRKRKKEEKAEAAPAGDCIDCNLCVRVCPTGIDIRNGTQLECINCTACIDACDEIMVKVDKPIGLIRYASEEEIVTGKRTIWNARSKAYTAVLCVLVFIMGFMLTSRTEVETTVMRAPGQLFQKLEEGQIQNLYLIQIANKTVEDKTVVVELLSPKGQCVLVGEQLSLKAKEQTDGAFFVQIHNDNLEGLKTPIELGIYIDGKLIETVSTNFMGPIKLPSKKAD